MPKNEKIKKVLVIGSGPIVIGQAAEFDYAGTQACRVLKQEGINVVLVNSNPATIMTDEMLADEIYLEPLTLETAARIIEKERPDGLMAGLGGQTGLTLSMQLHESGVLDKYGVKILGSDINAIKKAEDRDLFRKTMAEIGQPCVPSEIAFDLGSAAAAAEKIGYPVIIRPAYTLGGSGGGIAQDKESFLKIAAVGLEASPISQILVEKCISGWKEIEFETMRDANGNSVCVCPMENVDPVGIHTGDSIVVAPTMTLSQKDAAMLRQAALDIVDALGIIGGCNCQFALHPETSEYAVIEVNPRVSRSSALASKASGYPIAKITALLALGYTLDEIKNEKTGRSCAGFEPSLDYIVVKFPKWPFDKFAGANRTLGTQMKATGEVMAIGKTFLEALMKAVRGAEIKLDSLNASPLNSKPLRERLATADDMRLFTVYEALKSGYSAKEISDITKIDEFFINCLNEAVSLEKALSEAPLTEELYSKAKKAGFPDTYIKRLAGGAKLPDFRLVYKKVDTCADVMPAQAPYYYSAAEGKCDARAAKKSGKPVIMVLGSGPIRIGQGIEFDYSSVHCIWALQKAGYEVVIVNNNPETVSTDYDTADRLYFEPLTEEDVMSVIAAENPEGVVVAFGGQTAIKLTLALVKNGVNILGTSAAGIDTAEDREKFDNFLESFGIKRPKAVSVNTAEEALIAARILGYPVLLRPSYVIGGQGMSVARSAVEVREFMQAILSQGIANSVLIDKYMPGTELEVDCISDGTNVLIPGIMEHVERAGIHSGDSIAVYPPYNLSKSMTGTVVKTSVEIARGLGTKGIVNIQYLVQDGELYVIEVNPRASRTVPYISKVTGIPMVELASRAMLGVTLPEMGYGTGLAPVSKYYAVKVPVFSFEKIADANTIMGPEMKSTGEVLGIGRTKAEALYKGLAASGVDVAEIKKKPGQGILISVEDYDYSDAITLAEKFTDLGISIYATPDTAKAIRARGIDVTTAHNVWENDDINDLVESGTVNYIVYTGAVMDSSVGDFRILHRKAMNLKIPCMTSIDTALALADVIAACYSQSSTRLININV
ncbi:MAG: carbamoyl-phosphate synthase large subunit [Clostridia bacterium]|nr:carbamoyl-phosphate synthase large subunit [Clostridia bacterium]